MGNRCFSESPDEVARFGKSYIEGIRESGILSCGKHFPGHGDTAVDSHFALPVVDKSLPALEQTELVSFREAIRTGLESIMTAHIVFPALDPDLPATISPRIQQGLLRQRLGFEGLVISDGMEMQAMQNLFPLPEGVFRALQAGIDIVLVCHEPNQAAAACERVLAAVEQGLGNCLLTAIPHTDKLVNYMILTDLPPEEQEVYLIFRKKESLNKSFKGLIRLAHRLYEDF